MPGSVIAITGTSRGLGQRLAELFVADGNRVYGCSRSKDIQGSDRYHHATVDIGDEAQVRQWVREIRKEAGTIDVLVCNAALVESVLPLTMTPSGVVESYLRTNVAGTYHVCREVSKIMAMQRSGRIIAISSIMTRLHEPGTSAYSATKSAVEEMIRVLARELVGANVTCNIVAPGLVPTDSTEAFGTEWRTRMLDLQTVKRPITPEEIFHSVSFFASPSAGSVTGQTLYLGLVD